MVSQLKLILVQSFTYEGWDPARNIALGHRFLQISAKCIFIQVQKLLHGNTAISKKFAPVIHDASSKLHCPRCVMGASLVGNKPAESSL